MNTAHIVISKSEYLALRDAFDLLAEIIDDVENETGWADDDEE